ncbi:glycosyltransferase family 4 protein [Erythrobacteraceae bacterium E2-1 Yellow Sea]|nr:glycosyltransferase family 4 protein [Erythrobacteraceae bacterium E2-1 Yellow Sea]
MELACERLVKDLLESGKEVRWLAQADGPLPDLPDGVCTPLAGTDIVYRMSGVPVPAPYPWAIKKIYHAVAWSDLVVIIEANFLLSVLASILARWTGRKVMLVQHVGQPSTTSLLARMVMRTGEALFTNRMVRNADAVVYVSRSVEANFNGIRDRGLTRTISHAIDVRTFDTAKSKTQRQIERQELGLPVIGKVACFVGRTTESKGISVIRHLALSKPDWSFAVAGQGPVDPAEWGLPNMFPLGQLSQQHVAMLYRCSDAMTLPSQSESFSLVVREAMACECRVICADQILETDPRLSEFITTVPVDLSRPEETAQHFAEALEDTRAADPANARAYVVCECSPDTVRKHYLDLVNSVLVSPEVRSA